MVENVKIQKFKCDILSNFQTMCYEIQYIVRHSIFGKIYFYDPRNKMFYYFLAFDGLFAFSFPFFLTVVQSILVQSFRMNELEQLFFFIGKIERETNFFFATNQKQRDFMHKLNSKLYNLLYFQRVKNTRFLGIIALSMMKFIHHFQGKNMCKFKVSRTCPFFKSETSNMKIHFT